MDQSQMTNIYLTYLSLLRAALWGDDGERLAVNGESLTDVIRFAAFQGTGPLVFDQLLKLKDIEIPADLKMQMKQQCLLSMRQQQVMIPLLSQAWNALLKAGIHPILLKGFGLAQYYPQPYLRQWGDMDVYVGQANYHKGSEVLRATFPGVSHTEEEDEDYKHYNFVFDNAVLEMHRVSMTFYHFRDWQYYEQLEAKYLTKDGPTFDCEGLTITTPEETFNVFFTFLHAWHHFCETGMSMKQLCDIAILLHTKREVIDEERLHEMLTKLYLMEVWQLIMYIIVHHLGVPQEECPFYTEKSRERAERLYKRVMQESSARPAARLNAEGASYLKRKWLTFQLRMADSRLVRPYAPRYARRMAISSILHGLERAFAGK